MYLLGKALTKLLATVAAVMTATAGVPSTQCRCPDGRIKFFCHGNASSPSGCCCATACSPAPETTPCCREPKKANAQGKAAKKRPCCGRTPAEPPKESGSDAPPPAVKATCCVKAVVALPAADSIVPTGWSPVDQSIEPLALGESIRCVPSPVAADAAVARPPPELLTTPPDLVIVLCHFTC